MYKIFLISVLWMVSASAYAETLSFSELGEGVLVTVIYSLLGIIMASLGFKVVDWLTPGNLAEDVSNKENRALAILAGSMILGVCIIIASAVVG